jgi:hypothetical protein
VSLAKLPPACSKCALVGYFYSGVLQFYDVSNPLSIPQPVTYRSANSIGYAPHVIDSEVVGNRAYVVVSADEFHGIEVLDLTNLPAPPTRLGQVNLPNDWKGAGKIRVLNDHVYYGVGRQYGPGGLRVFNVNDPRNPKLVASLDIEDIGQIPWRGTGLDVVERGWFAYAYMVGRTALHVIDVSRPDQPKLSASYPLPPEWGQLEGGNVIVRNGIAYVAASRGDGVNGHGGLAIYRVGWF